MRGKRIILFDIDGTIFDALSFIEGFYQTISQVFNLSDQDIGKIKKIYKKTKEKYDYFYPPYFESKITKIFPKILGDELHKILWNVDLFEKNVYKDASAINSLTNIVIGILSKGDSDFQRQKIKFIKNLAEENIHVFKNKIENLGQVLKKYNDYEIFLVDNETEVLRKAKALNRSVITILINRNGKQQEDNGIIKIKNLEEIKKII
ncbi:MAG: HAD hydrolase-like protein [Candidatus Levybacteria bacterium]|nr:HAD hydrolase-like protein [Candidatus Levybacteria bacterium]